MNTIFDSVEIPSAPLLTDAIYRGDSNFDCLPKLLGCGNRGGFRRVGSFHKGYKFVVLYSSLEDVDWPDSIDFYNGLATYYGDNKNAGSDLHQTSQGGNRFLRDIFISLHEADFSKIPPIFLFSKGETGKDVIFRGLLVPGGEGITQTEDLVAIWKMSGGQRFQNYRAIFTILNVPLIGREWISDLQNGISESNNAPKDWIKWRRGGKPSALKAEKTIESRTIREQLPENPCEVEILKTVYSAYADDSYGFEKCAAELVKLMDENVTGYDLTQRTRDGGRDAIGEYKIGLPENAITIEFAIEAKCYATTNSVGIKETSRLISRLRHRQIGFLVTTSSVNLQAYKEIVEDGHPVVIVSGKDIVKILSKAGYNDKNSVAKWLQDIRSR